MYGVLTEITPTGRTNMEAVRFEGCPDKYGRYEVIRGTFDSEDVLYRFEKEMRRRYGRIGTSFCPDILSNPSIKEVIFNNPATVVIWADGTKTVVKCQEGDTYNEELGLAMCISKKFFGNKGNFNEVFKKWIPKEPELSIEEMRQAITRHCTARNGLGCKGCAIDALPGHIVGRCAKFANDEEVVRHYKVIRKN
jgi:hypothetical protein